MEAPYHRNTIKILTLLTEMPTEYPVQRHDSLNSSRNGHLAVRPKMRILISQVPSTGALKSVPVHNAKACGGVKVERHPFLTSALDEGEWSASQFTCSTHQ